MYSCPHCHKQVKNLKKHIKRMHPNQVSQEPAKESTPALKFEVKKPKEQPKPKEPTATTSAKYHCVDCGGPLEKGQAVCPNCGATLDWSAI